MQTGFILLANIKFRDFRNYIQMELSRLTKANYIIEFEANAVDF